MLKRLKDWVKRLMAHKDDDDLGKVIGGAAIFLGALWLLSKLVKNQPIPRCPNCNLTLQNGITQCPRCGVFLQWNS